jgi:hypothetical protein
VSLTESPPGVQLHELRVRDGYASLGAPFVEQREPTPLPEPYPVAFNPAAAALLGLQPGEAARPEFCLLAAGNARFRGAAPTAAVYAGHQFGTYVSQLGDGRAITLGEIENDAGERWEWQLKGSGRTAFSRFGDGRAVLRSTIREYLCSEAMYGLEIPTTRALAIAGSAEPVFREQPETAAVLSRLAPSHVRFGTFEYFHYAGEPERVKTLADYVLTRFFAELQGPERYAEFLRTVVERTAELIARWQAAGFQHGVMNTDNMSILGLTLDYGPFGFMETYDPAWICNHSDESGRYAFERQPGIGLWNCKALANALSSLVAEPEIEAALAAYEPAYRKHVLALMRAKFGLAVAHPGDPELIAACLDLLAKERADYPTFFRDLAASDERAGSRLADLAAWRTWGERYAARLALETRDEAARRAAMLRANPKYVLRNHLAQRAIEAAEAGAYEEIERLRRLLAAPFDEHPGFDDDARPAPPGTPAVDVSCSS